MKLIIILILALISPFCEPYSNINIRYENKTYPFNEFRSKMLKILKKESRVLEYIDYSLVYSAKYKVDPVLVLSVIWVESNFKKDAISNAGAVGAMQLMRGTVTHIETMPGTTIQGMDRKNVKHNLKYGVKYLSYLLKRFKGDVVKSIVAYNMGPSWVEKKANQRKLLGHRYYRLVVGRYDKIKDRMKL